MDVILSGQDEPIDMVNFKPSLQGGEGVNHEDMKEECSRQRECQVQRPHYKTLMTHGEENPE